MDNIVESINKLEKIYGHLTYFDQYGTSFFIFCILTFILFIVHSYCYVMINIQPIKDDWVNERCKPSNIPFAGLINKPDNQTISEYTQTNFTYCVQTILTNISGYAIEPITFITNELKKIHDKLTDEIQSIRQMFDNIRNNVKAIGEEIMGRLMNTTIPIQQIVIGVRDMLSKTQGVMTSGLYTMLGSYYTLQSLMGAIAELIIDILIALVAVIVVLWIIPFTWGAAASMTSIFIAIAIPLSIILAFMIDVLQVQTSGIPQLKCFDKKTEFIMNDGKVKTIEDIEIGDILHVSGVVTEKIKVATKGSTMYTLHGVIVSDTHLVRYKDQWIHVSKHPESITIKDYEEPYLYCMNTTSKRIYLNNLIFTDWHDLTEEGDIKNPDFYSRINGGFSENTLIRCKNGLKKRITNIQIGDILEKGEIVYGIVEINGSELENQYIYYLGSECSFKGGPNIIFSHKGKTVSSLFLDEKYKIINISKEDTLYHLLTNTGFFHIQHIKINDYNSCIDFFSKQTLLESKLFLENKLH